MCRIEAHRRRRMGRSLLHLRRTFRFPRPELDSKPAQPTAVGKNWSATMEGSEQGSGGMELATWANDTLGGDQILESYAG